MRACAQIFPIKPRVIQAGQLFGSLQFKTILESNISNILRLLRPTNQSAQVDLGLDTIGQLEVAAIARTALG